MSTPISPEKSWERPHAFRTLQCVSASANGSGACFNLIHTIPPVVVKGPVHHQNGSSGLGLMPYQVFRFVPLLLDMACICPCICKLEGFLRMVITGKAAKSDSMFQFTTRWFLIGLSVICWCFKGEMEALA